MNYKDAIKQRIDELTARKLDIELELQPLIKELDALVSALRTIEEGTGEINSDKKYYNYRDSLANKILFVLKEKEFIGATAREIFDYMTAQQDIVSFNSITKYCSDMAQSGAIISEKHGLANVYFLKEGDNFLK
ncbi:MAG: hypothetical protein V4622_12915 [Bacteroidota bacterium]